jgi:uncharacterized protein YcbX
MHDQLKVGSLASLHRYPVKSMMGEEINASWIGAKGILGDRAFALADPETGKIASAKNPSKWPNLFEFRAAFTGPPKASTMLPPVQITFPDGSTVTTDSESVESLLAASLAKPVRFLKMAEGSGTLEEYWPDIEGLARRDEVTDEAMPSETFFDVGIVHLVTTGTLDTLRAAYPAGRFETRRFRPNLVINTGPDAGDYPEQQWGGKVMAIGPDVKLKITGPCFRCVMTTLEQGDLPKDHGILRAAAKHNEARVGAYAAVIRGGMIKRGDTVVLEPG